MAMQPGHHHARFSHWRRLRQWGRRRKMLYFTVTSLLFIVSLIFSVRTGNMRRILDGSHRSKTEQQVDTSDAIGHILNDVLFSKADIQKIEENSFKISGRPVVILSVASNHMLDLAQNLHCFVTSSSSLRPVIFSMDTTLSSRLESSNVTSISLHSKVDTLYSLFHTKLEAPGGPIPFGTKSFSIATHLKLLASYHVLGLGYDVIMTDVDIIWCKNMRLVFEQQSLQFPHIDMFMQGNQRKELTQGQPNTGFYYAKSSDNVLKVFRHVVDGIPAAIERGQDDQGLFWDRVCCDPTTHPICPFVTVQKYDNGQSRMECRWISLIDKSVLRIQYLPLTEFPNGFKDMHGRLLEILPPNFYQEQCRAKRISIWHANFCKGSDKRRIMMKQGVFLEYKDGIKCKQPHH